MSKAIVVVALVIALIASYPYVSTISKAEEMKGSYVFKWSEVSPFEKGVIYEKILDLTKKVNFWTKTILEIAGIVVFLLTVIEYYKFHKIYKEEMKE